MFFGLGTNLGDREGYLRSAIEGLGEVGSTEAVSSVYRSEPLGYGPQPDFWNLALLARTRLAPLELLERTQEIERRLGRVPSFRNAPRTIDIDLLLYGDLALSTDRLTLPHPRLTERAFVLLPLLELDADLRDPVTGERLADRLPASQGRESTERLFPGSRLLAGAGRGKT